MKKITYYFHEIAGLINNRNDKFFVIVTDFYKILYLYYEFNTKLKLINFLKRNNIHNIADFSNFKKGYYITLVTDEPIKFRCNNMIGYYYNLSDAQDNIINNYNINKYYCIITDSNKLVYIDCIFNNVKSLTKFLKTYIAYNAKDSISSYIKMKKNIDMEEPPYLYIISNKKPIRMYYDDKY